MHRASAAAPSVAAHAVTAPRIAFMHTWLATQTEGWWRYAFDAAGVPFDYISTQTVANQEDLHAKYDVIVFAPVGRASALRHPERHSYVEQSDAVAEIGAHPKSRRDRLAPPTFAPAWATKALRI